MIKQKIVRGDVGDVSEHDAEGDGADAADSEECEVPMRCDPHEWNGKTGEANSEHQEGFAAVSIGQRTEERRAEE